MSILNYEFMQNALLVGILASIACGIIGSYVVVKRMVFISGSISHTAYGGIGIGYYLGISPIMAASVFTLCAAVLMGLISRRFAQRQDTIIGMMWAVGMAIGIIFVHLSHGYTADLMSYLFGNILTVPRGDLWFIIALNVIILAAVLYYYEEFRAIAFDEEFAEVIGIKTERMNLLLLILVALTVVVLIRVVGIILVIALLTMPAAIAGQFTSDLKKMMIMATALGMGFTSGGLLLAYYFNLPSGATIILLAAACFIISFVSKNLSKTRQLVKSTKTHNF